MSQVCAELNFIFIQIYTLSTTLCTPFVTYDIMEHLMMSL